LAVLAVVLNTGWQIGSCELANVELRDDLVDLAAQAGSRIGLKAPVTDDDLRETIVGKARGYGIQLDPRQVTVRHVAAVPSLYLAADYETRVRLLGLTFTLHFSPSSKRAP
jgi:hypothetical protein